MSKDASAGALGLRMYCLYGLASLTLYFLLGSQWEAPAGDGREEHEIRHLSSWLPPKGSPWDCRASE